MHTTRKTCWSSVALLLSVLFTTQTAVSQPPLPGPSQLSLVTSGDICAPVNVGKANRVIQNIRGHIFNNSATESISVSCPILTAHPTVFVETGGVIGNGSSETHEVRCVVRELSLWGDEVQKVVRSEILEPHSAFFFQFYAVELSDPSSRLNMTCVLPPMGGLGLVGIDSY